jgi:hypothetical protein
MSASARRFDRAAPAADHERAIAALRDALARLRFGTIALTIHDGRVVQIETCEKHRFDT